MGRAVIVGGGIGGLATALSVADAGHRVVVLERAERFAEIGAGIQIAPNGIHALDALGVGPEVRQIAVQMDELRFMDGVTDRHVASLPLTERYQQKFGTPYLVVHRGELHRLLLDACLNSSAITLRSSCPAVGYEQTTGTAAVVLQSGERVVGEVVIGADGIHSRIRRQLVGDGDPQVSGLVVYRTMVAMEEVPAQLRLPTSVTWWTGPERHLVHYPIVGGRYLNLAGSRYTATREPIVGMPVSTEFVQSEFAVMGPTTRRLIALGSEWKAWALVDRDPVENWVDGRVALLGDAAHPMLHYAAQGACQALEDAVVLGRLLECPTADLPERLTRYNAQRRQRTARIQHVARESIRLWHASGPAAEARNAALSAMSDDELHNHIAWMHASPTLQPAPAN